MKVPFRTPDSRFYREPVYGVMVPHRSLSLGVLSRMFQPLSKIANKNPSKCFFTEKQFYIPRVSSRTHPGVLARTVLYFNGVI